MFAVWHLTSAALLCAQVLAAPTAHPRVAASDDSYSAVVAFGDSFTDNGTYQSNFFVLLSFC